MGITTTAFPEFVRLSVSGGGVLFDLFNLCFSELRAAWGEDEKLLTRLPSGTQENRRATRRTQTGGVTRNQITIRVISKRKATRNEEKSYFAQIDYRLEADSEDEG